MTNFILIPGRSSRQGVTLNEGKYTDGYQDETSTLRMHPDDMAGLGISEGDTVRMWNEIGEVLVPVIDAGDECPEGLVFICYGDKSSRLMGGETHGSGMPDSKGLDVSIAPHKPSAPATDPLPVESHSPSNGPPPKPLAETNRVESPRTQRNGGATSYVQTVIAVLVALALIAVLILSASG